MPRSRTVLPDAAGYYHCISRCVRRAWLCGEDPVSGMNFDHRRDWIEDRLIDLSNIFAVGLYGYAVMSNHVHVAIFVDPSRAQAWPAEEVARRWCALSRSLEPRDEHPAEFDERVQTLLGNDERLAEVRGRLGSLSWFMRFLNEAIARAANREDGCTGRFWEGRFQCKRLEDEAALLGCMVYVDLNPVRAGIVSSIEASGHTSVRRRLTDCDHQSALADEDLAVVAGEDARRLAITNRAYLELVEWTGRCQRSDKRGFIEGPTCLTRLSCSQSSWLKLTSGLEKLFGAAVGSKERLKVFSEQTGRRWVRGAANAW